MYTVLRLMFVMMYVSGLPTLRILMWTLAFAANVCILFVGYR